MAALCPVCMTKLVKVPGYEPGTKRVPLPEATTTICPVCQPPLFKVRKKLVRKVKGAP